MGSVSSMFSSEPGDEVIDLITRTGHVNVIYTPTDVDLSQDVRLTDEMKFKRMGCFLCNENMAQVYNEACNHKFLCYHCLVYNFPSTGLVECPINNCHTQLTILR